MVVWYWCGCVGGVVVWMMLQCVVGFFMGLLMFVLVVGTQYCAGGNCFCYY